MQDALVKAFIDAVLGNYPKLALVIFWAGAQVFFLWWWRHHFWGFHSISGKRTALLSIILAVITYVSCRCIERYWGIPRPFESDKIGILIGEEPGDDNRSDQTAYQSAIESHVKAVPKLDGVLQTDLIERPLSRGLEEQQEEALKIGRWVHAAFVLRPLKTGGGRSIWLTIVDQEGFTANSAYLGSFPSSQLSLPDKMRMPTDLLMLARCVLGISLFRRSEFRDSADELNAILASQDLPPAAPSRANLNYFLALDYLDLNDRGLVQDAVNAARNTATLAPESDRAHNLFGVALMTSGDYGRSKAELENAIALNPSREIYHANLCSTLGLLRQPDEAIVQCDTALRLNDRDITAKMTLGAVLEDLGRHDEAIKAETEVIKVDGNYAAAHYNLARSFVNIGRVTDAIVELKAAIKIDPSYADAHAQLGYVYEFKNKDLESAEPEYEAAIVADPNNLYALVNFCALLDKRQDYDKAIEMCDRAIAVDPRSPDASLLLGDALLGKGRINEAMSQYKKGLEIAPESEMLKERLARVEALRHSQSGVRRSGMAMRTGRRPIV